VAEDEEVVNITTLDPANINDMKQDSMLYMVANRDGIDTDLNVPLGQLKNYVIGTEIIRSDHVNDTDMITIHRNNLEQSHLLSVADLNAYLNGTVDLALKVTDQLRLNAYNTEQKGYTTIGAIKSFLQIGLDDKVLASLGTVTTHYSVRLNYADGKVDENYKFSLDKFRNWLFVSQSVNDIRDSDAFLFRRKEDGETKSITFDVLDKTILPTEIDLAGREGGITDDLYMYGRSGSNRGIIFVPAIYDYFYSKYDPFEKIGFRVRNNLGVISDNNIEPVTETYRFLIKDNEKHGYMTIAEAKRTLFNNNSLSELEDATLFYTVDGRPTWNLMRQSLMNWIFGLTTAGIQNDINDADVFLMFPHDDPERKINGVSWVTIRDKILNGVGNGGADHFPQPVPGDNRPIVTVTEDNLSNWDFDELEKCQIVFDDGPDPLKRYKISLNTIVQFVQKAVNG